MNNSPPQSRATVAAVVGVCICILANLLLPTWVDSTLSGRTALLVAYFIAGAVAGQIALLAAWSALGTGSAFIRVPGAACLVVVLSLAAGLSVAIAEDLDVVVALVFIALQGFFCLQLPLWLFRKLSGYRIAPLHAGAVHDGRSQFGVRHILGLTGVVALAVGVAKMVFPADVFVTEINSFWVAWLILAVVQIVLSALVTLPSVWIMLGARYRLVAVFFLLNVLAVGPVAAVALAATRGLPVSGLLIGLGYSAAFGAGLTAMQLVGLFALRKFGYRLRSPSVQAELAGPVVDLPEVE